MSDYMFMLESHMSAAQSRVVAGVQAVAAEANMSLFLTGGAMRDMLGGFPIRDLDFTVEGDPKKLLKPLIKRTGARVTLADRHRGLYELVFPNNVTASLSMSRVERYPRPGGRPEVSAATIAYGIVTSDGKFAAFDSQGNSLASGQARGKQSPMKVKVTGKINGKVLEVQQVEME